jgi:hypothetical protein
MNDKREYDICYHKVMHSGPLLMYYIIILLTLCSSRQECRQRIGRMLASFVSITKQSLQQLDMR